ncbi:MAG TPA: hypothetical protein VFX86_01990 [Candidatus Saccharimonadales bacterium]|nr:hypothetical protein [Candidatus Saccharimonadales bacterium]
MTKLISEILDIPQPLLFKQIQELERISGKPGLDIRLANELKLLFKEKAGHLGLDENDTTPSELYFAMAHLVFKHSDELAKTIAIKPDDSPEKMVKQSIGFIEKRIGVKKIWALKTSAARRQLKENPPKKLMNIFGIRSIDSALKRDKSSLFYCFASLVEPATWVSRYANQATKLTLSDFDEQNITVSILSENRKQRLIKAGISPRHIVYSHQETAGIVVALPDKRFRGDVLFIVDSILLLIKNMLEISAYYRKQSLNPGFFNKVAKIRGSGFNSVGSDDMPIDWPAMVYAATELRIPGLLDDEELSIGSEDLLVPTLPQLAGFGFWKHPFGAYKEADIIVPFNLSDMIINAVNGVEPERAYKENSRKHLKKELFGRYLHHEPVREIVINIKDPPKSGKT